MAQRAQRSTAWATGICWILFTTGAALADGFDDQRQQSAQQTPQGLTLKLSLERQTFQIGEVIPIVLKFQSSTPGYQIDTANYDRSGRLGTLRFTSDGPAGGWVDPLEHYFDHGYFMAGGLSGGYTQLGDYHQEFELNQWVRFDKPGMYHVYCTSSQVSMEQSGQRKAVALVSNVVQFKMVATDAALIQQTLHAAKVYLNSPDHRDPSRGAQLLRYLGTHEAVDALVPALANQNTGAQAMMGLISARDRAYAIQALDRAMADPALAKNETYIRARSELNQPLPTTHPSASR